MSEAWIQAVLLDAAGTLIELAEPVGETYARRARDFEVDVPASRIEEAFARVLASAAPNVHPGESLERAAQLERSWWYERVRETFCAADQMARFSDFEGFFETLWHDYGRASAWRLAAGTEQALGALEERGVRLAIVSNFDQRLRPLLEELGIHARFEAITLPSDAGAAKPDPAIFTVCLKRLGLAAHRAIYVGDGAERDLGASRHSGPRPVEVASLATLAELPVRLDALESEAPPAGRRLEVTPG